MVIRALLLICVVFALLESEASATDSDEGIRVLFVGNSLTYYNDVPELTRQFYEAVHGPGSMRVEMLASGGKSMASHLEDGHFQRTLSNEGFDFVVLQDVGGFPICDPSFPGCKGAVASMASAVTLSSHHEAVPVWYSTFQSNPQVQKALSRKVHALGDDWGVAVADVGAALTFYRDQLQQNDGFLDDGHPDLVGSLIAAATIVMAIQGATLPPDLNPGPVCFRRWQGTGLRSNSLASGQEAPERSCEAIAPATMNRIIESANTGVNSGTGETRDG